MSHKASSWAMVQLPESITQKAVLMVLADFHRNDTGLCFPSALTIADLLMCNERTVRRALQDLETQGFIRLAKRDRKPALVYFNWTRLGFYEFKKDLNPTTDTESVAPKEVSSNPDQPRAARGRFAATDTESADSEKNQSTDNDDTTLRTLTTPPTDTDAKTTDTESDYPGYPGYPGEEPWEPSAATLSALCAIFQKDFKIPDHWIPMFMVKIDAEEIPPQKWNAYFIEWAQYQVVKDRKIQTAATESNDQPNRTQRPPLNDKPEVIHESPVAKLNHAERMASQIENPDLKKFWLAEAAKLKLAGGSRG